MAGNGNGNGGTWLAALATAMGGAAMAAGALTKPVLAWFRGRRQYVDHVLGVQREEIDRLHARVVEVEAEHQRCLRDYAALSARVASLEETRRARQADEADDTPGPGKVTA